MKSLPCRTGLVFAASLSAVTMVFVGSAPRAYAGFMTGFETSDGFTAGQKVDGVDGFSASSSVVATDQQANTGSQSADLPGGKAAKQTGLSDSNLTDYSVAFRPPGVGGHGYAAWLYLFTNAQQDGTIHLRVGVSGGQDYIAHQSNGGSRQVTLIGASEQWKRDQWNTLSVKLHPSSSTYDIQLNGTSYSGLSGLAVPNDASSFTGTWLLNHASSDHLYYDDLSISPVPEPASLALVGVGFAGFLRRRSRHNPARRG